MPKCLQTRMNQPILTGPHVIARCHVFAGCHVIARRHVVTHVLAHERLSLQSTPHGGAAGPRLSVRESFNSTPAPSSQRACSARTTGPNRG
jgi:hypothetical protein